MIRNEFKYAPYYCEENIWQLCQEEVFRPFEKRAVLISNPTRTCALWNQRAAPLPEQPVIWDYHVILLFKSATDGWQVFDLDTTLPAPISVDLYLSNTFGNEPLSEEFQSLFRVIDADEFVDKFSSDRSHMLTADGQWQVPPPPWPAIVRNNKSNLMELIDMRKSSIGTAMNLVEFRNHFAQSS